MSRILATGFGAFPGAPVNPTAWLMDDLAGWEPEGATLVRRTLPVTFDVWETDFAPLIAEVKPNAIVAFGFGAKATGITLETTARNRLATDRPDAAGRLAPAAVIDPAGPATLAGVVPDLPFVRSDDAGDYICNLVLYRLLAAGHHAGFVHVPHMEPAELRAGARAILDATASLLCRAR